MKFIKGITVIIVLSFIGELLNNIIPIPIPASIYGLVMLFLCLELKIIKIEEVKPVGLFLIEIMPIMFIPAGVGLINSYIKLRVMIVPLLIITIIGTIFVMIVSGKITQKIIRNKFRSGL